MEKEYKIFLDRKNNLSDIISILEKNKEFIDYSHIHNIPEKAMKKFISKIFKYGKNYNLHYSRSELSIMINVNGINDKYDIQIVSLEANKNYYTVYAEIREILDNKIYMMRSEVYKHYLNKFCK